MKKTTILITVFLLLMAVTQYAYAGSYTFNNGGITFDLKDGVTVYTNNNDVEDIPGVPKDFELLVRTMDPDYYWYFYYINSDNTIDFNALDDDSIAALIENDSTDVGTDGVSYEIYDNGNKYLVIDSYSEKTDE